MKNPINNKEENRVRSWPETNKTVQLWLGFLDGEEINETKAWLFYFGESLKPYMEERRNKKKSVHYRDLEFGFIIFVKGKSPFDIFSRDLINLICRTVSKLPFFTFSKELYFLRQFLFHFLNFFDFFQPSEMGEV